MDAKFDFSLWYELNQHHEARFSYLKNCILDLSLARSSTVQPAPAQHEAERRGFVGTGDRHFPPGFDRAAFPASHYNATACRVKREKLSSC